MKSYSESLKRKLVQRMLVPNGPSAYALSGEVGIPQPTLSRWKRSFGTIGPMASKSTPLVEQAPRRPEDWSVEERLAAVTEASRLTESELGEFLRRQGLHEETLAMWHAAALEGLRGSEQRPRGAEKKRIQQLERELARKDKALAETAALLVLKKKVQAIWGDGGDGTGEPNDD